MRLKYWQKSQNIKGINKMRKLQILVRDNQHFLETGTILVTYSIRYVIW